MAKDDGGPAFARSGHQPFQDGGASYYGDAGAEGMSLRDYFAAKAMQAALSNQSMLDKMRAGSKGDLEKAHQWLTEGAYLVADAMLKERLK